MQRMCPAEGGWPETPALSTALLPCGTGYFGEKQRFCNADGVWEEETASACGRRGEPR